MASDNGNDQKLNAWGKLTALSTAIAAVLIPVVIAIVGQEFSASIKEREVQSRFVELAINILRQPPAPDAKNLRRWAGEVINKYSGVPLGSELSSDLIERLPLPATEVESQVLRELAVKPLLPENKLELGGYSVGLTTLINSAPPGACMVDVRLNGASIKAREDDSRVFDLGSKLPGKSATVAVLCRGRVEGPVDVKLIFRTEREAVLFGDRFFVKTSDPNGYESRRYAFSFAYKPV